MSTTQKTRARSPIMEAVHEAAADLHRHGFIDQRRMRKYDLICLEPVTGYDAQKIRSLRERYQLSQSVLASLLNTSLSAVRQWEAGNKRPSGPSQKLLSILDHKGIDAFV